MSKKRSASALADDAYEVGIDEAGRGPVLGPMVYGICYSPLGRNAELKKMGFADSKTLDEEQRDKLFDAIGKTDWIGYDVDVIMPQSLSANMLRIDKYNLNSISHDSAIALLKKVIDKGINVTNVYVDTVGDPEKYQTKLESIFPNIQICVSKKADSLYTVVSAASICAKVTRDKVLKEWQFEEAQATPKHFSREFGSGYPGDPKTKEWLTNNINYVFGFPSLIRFSWQTTKKILQDQCAAVEFKNDDEGEDKEHVIANRSILDFTTTLPNGKAKPPKRSKYFQSRSIHSVEEL